VTLKKNAKLKIKKSTIFGNFSPNQKNKIQIKNLFNGGRQQHIQI